MRSIAVAVLTVALAGCSLTEPKDDPVQIKLNDLEARLGRIERVVSNQSLLELAQRLDAVQSDLRALHGQLDELANSQESLRKQQRDLYADLDRRLTGLGAGGGALSAPTPASGAPSVAPSTGSGIAAGEQAAYTQAFDALKAANYPGAIAGFNQFLTTYPASGLADNAQYWLGEAYYVTKDFAKASVAFRTVGEKWPGSRKSADALLKLGFSEFELKHYTQSRALLNEVVSRFADTDAARLAADRLKRFPADAR